MKILLIHNSYQYFGGEDMVVRAEMALLRRNGHAVQLYTRSNSELHQLPAARAAMAAISAVWSRHAAAEVDEICEEFEPDVIHVHNTFLVISPSIFWVAARRGIALVQTLHNFRLLCPQGTFLRNGAVCEDCLNRKLWRPVIRKCYRGSALQSSMLAGMLTAHACLGTYRNKVTRYIALSAFSRARFIEGGLPAEKFRIKPNFVDADRLPEWDSRDGGLFVGRLSKEKGIETLLEAIRICNDSRFRVIGDGPYEHALASCLGKRYLGFLPADKVRNEMHASAFLVLPSIGHEQMPMTVLEAFACGLPVIASRRGALAEIVQDGVTGLLIEPANASDLAEKIQWAQKHPASMEAMGRAARAEYEMKYTGCKNYQLLMDIYNDAIATVH